MIYSYENISKEVSKVIGKKCYVSPLVDKDNNSIGFRALVESNEYILPPKDYSQYNEIRKHIFKHLKKEAPELFL